jgi:hypothetical protein
VVVAAVSSELVSARKFAVYREFTGKIGCFGHRYAKSGHLCSDLMLLYRGLGGNSLFFQEQGIFQTRTGNAPV